MRVIGLFGTFQCQTGNSGFPAPNWSDFVRSHRNRCCPFCFSLISAILDVYVAAVAIAVVVVVVIAVVVAWLLFKISCLKIAI